MNVLCGRRDALAFAAVLAFAGCSGAAANVAPNASFVAAQHHGAPSMMKGLGNVALLYVTNADGRVSVYNYLTLKRVGVLTGFTMPKGECDRARSLVRSLRPCGNRALAFRRSRPEAVRCIMLGHASRLDAKEPYGIYSVRPFRAIQGAWPSIGSRGLCGSNGFKDHLQRSR